MADLVRVDKRTLQFQAKEAGADVHPSDTLEVTNVADCDLAFKVKTTNQARYIVRPSVGVIPEGDSLSILIGVQPNEQLEAGPCKDKFLLRIAKEPGASQRDLPQTYWIERENDPDVVGIKFKVAIVEHLPEQEQVDEHVDVIDEVAPVVTAAPSPVAASHVPRQRDLPPSVLPPVSTSPGNVVASPVIKESRPVEPESPVNSPTGILAASPRSSGVSDSAEAGVVDLADADELLREGNYDKALERVRELQAMLDEKNLELARLRTELAETKAESERVLKEAPKVPLSANKVLSDPFGGVSVAGIGLMLILFLVLVNIIFRIS